MRSDIFEKEKSSGRSTRMEPFTVTLIPPVLDLDAAQDLQYRRLQEESAAREKKLAVEFETRQAAALRDLEAALEQKQKRVIDAIKAGHAADCRRIEQDGVEKALVLQGRLEASQRRLSMVIVVAGISLLVAISFKSGVGQPQNQAVTAPVEVSLPVAPVAAATTPDPVAEVIASEEAPATAPSVAASAATTTPVPVRKGNAGNFSGGKSSVK